MREKPRLRIFIPPPTGIAEGILPRPSSFRPIGRPPICDWPRGNEIATLAPSDASSHGPSLYSASGSRACHQPQGELLGADLSGTVSDRADDDMDLFTTINPLLVVFGFVVGMLVGLTGVGGGSLMTPILVLLFGVHATTAVGTDLLYAAITKTGGTLTHGLKERWAGVSPAGSLPVASRQQF